MDKFDELLEKLNSLEIRQDSGYWDENIPKDIWNEYFETNHKEVASGIDVDKHRWYEVSTTVVEIYGRYLGVDHVSDLFSESMDFSDCGVQMRFREVKPVTTITYK